MGISAAFALPADQIISTKDNSFHPRNNRYLLTFVELSPNHKHSNNLYDVRNDCNEENQDVKHLVLQTVLSIVCYEEGEADKEQLSQELAR
jgi:hypothetical protein